MEKRLPTRAGSKKRVDAQKGYRYVTPAVRLERKQISMLNPPPGSSPLADPHPLSLSTSDASTRTTIVGKKGPLEEEGSSLVPRAPPNGQSPEPTTEEPQTEPSKKEVPPSQEQTQPGKHQDEEGEVTSRTRTKTTQKETRTQELSQGTQEELQVTHQELTQEPQELGPRTTPSETEARTTSTTDHEPSAGSRSPSSTSTTTTTTTTTSVPGRPNVQFPDQSSRLETADLLEFFEEQAPVKESTVQIAEQSVRPESATVMEFFEGQPVRQESVQVPRQTAKQETAEVIEFFEEQDHSLKERSRPSLLLVPSPQHGGSLQRGQRSPSPGSLHASVGLNHLDNLIRLMEQLSALKDENAHLRKKCDYLETTKSLLKARSELMSTSESSSASGHQTVSSARHKAHHHHHHHRHHHRNGSGTRDAEGSRPRLFSAEDVQCLDISESASDSRPKRPKAPMHKRSFSTGSLEVEILDETSTGEGRITKSKSGKSVFSSKSTKQKSKASKWARVKKVLTGQFWYEDLGTTLKSLKELGRPSQRYSTISAEGQDFSPPSQQRPLDTSLDPDLLGPHRPRTSSACAEASSADHPPNIPGLGAGGGVEELGTEIWMGPPGWWEQYEASKRQSETSTPSDVSSVIEVKTMYLGSKQKDTERLLKVQPLTRRRSSPSLTTKDAEGEEEEAEEDVGIHRSASYKDEDLDLLPKDLSGSGTTGGKSDSKKLHRKAWGRVKDIIHVRKDSVKKRARREREKESSEWSQSEEVSEVDIEAFTEEQLAGLFGEGIISKSTPKTSPITIPRQSASSKSFSESPPQASDLAPPPPRPAAPAGGADMAALLGGSLSEDFAQKLHAWQALQLRKSPSFKGPSSGQDTEGGGSQAGGTEGTVGLESQELLSSSSGALALSGADSRAKGTTSGAPALDSPTEGAALVADPSSTEPQAPTVNVEELQRRISESFSRKLAEWERRKYRRPTTPEMEPKNVRGRKEKEKEKEERPRSKKSREEKERERMEKAREREIQKVEKEQVKLEKEKVRIEKERQRALERQAKLERMKGRLSQVESDPPSSPNAPVYGSPPHSALTSPPSGAAQDPVAQYKVTADFKKKLDEWEQMKTSLTLPDHGTSSPEGLSLSPSPQPAPSTAPTFTLGPGTDQGRPPPLSLQPYYLDTPEERSPVDKASDVSYGDDSTSVTEESYTRSNITSLERANSELLREVAHKEEEYSSLQEEVNKLNSKLDKVRQEHAAEMARFRRELEAGVVTTPVQLEVGELESTVRELEEKIILMENAGDQLAESMETAAIGKWQSVEGEEVVSQQLLDMVEQMKGMLVHAVRSRELSQKTMALHNFENVYSHAMKLQVQMNNLRVSQLERNKEIMLIKRQLLLQEVNNVLLQAHITRRETELYQYREAKRHGVAVRRWNTFSGQGDNESRPQLLRNISVHDGDDPHHIHPHPLAPSSSKHSSKHEDIPLITDEDVCIPTPGVAEGTRATTSELPPSSSQPPTTTTLTPHLPQQPPTDLQECHPSSVAPTATSLSYVQAAEAAPVTSPVIVDQGQPQASPSSKVPDTGAAVPVQHTTTPPASKDTSVIPPAATTTTNTTSTALVSVAGKVETGSPTLSGQTSLGGPSVSCVTPGGPPPLPDTETPVLPIPERRDTGVELSSRPALSPSPDDDINSQTESVMECTASARRPEAGRLPPEPTSPISPSPEPTSPTSPSPESAVVSVEYTRRPQPPKAMRSPVTRQKYLRRQKEEREKRKDRAASPKSSNSSDGKPPLPKQSTPHQSPSPSHRSKSVGDMDGFQPHTSHTEAPLREVIEKFEKRATVCETEERKIEFRKTPSPTMHLPRVGLVSRVRRLKPAAELLEESQRYRSGHSIYATRIMQRYLPGKASQHSAADGGPDKENVSSHSYVQAIVKRLSRENTPVKSAGSSSASSSLSLHRTDSPGRARPDLVSQLAHKLSSSSGPADTSHKTSLSSAPPSLPFKDRTNDSCGNKPVEAFPGEGAHGPMMTDQTSRPHDTAASDRTRSTETTLQPASVTGAAVCPHEAKPESTISPLSHASMPALASDEPEDLEDGARERASTYCIAEGDRSRQLQQLRSSDNGSASIEHIAEEFLDPTLLSIRERKGQKISPSSSTKSKNTLCCQSSACTKSKSSSSSSSQSSGAQKTPSSPRTQERRGRKEKMETIGVLCKQSMSFDLGVSLRAQSPDSAPQRPVSAESLRPAPQAEGGGIKVRPSSTSSEGEVAASGEGKKKSRGRFLDSSWLQKPKKFFKVSK